MLALPDMMLYGMYCSNQQMAMFDWFNVKQTYTLSTHQIKSGRFHTSELSQFEQGWKQLWQGGNGRVVFIYSMSPFDTVFQRARWGGQMSFKIILIRLNLNPANGIEGENQTVRQ